MKIVSLLENTAFSDRVKSEHGLSLYIETASRKILFDMGQTDLFYENALNLGIDLKEIDFAILSHGHYDHGGGLRKFLEINKKSPVYISIFAFGNHFHGDSRYIGLDAELKENKRIVFTENEFEIDSTITLFSCNNKERKHNLGSFGLTREENGKFIPDDFRHEQYLLIEESGKRYLISGCSHKGILDITEWFSPDFLIGGFHFSSLPLDDKLVSFAEYLDSFPTEFYTCHCTGTAQYEFMKNHMKKLHYLSCGDSISI